MKKKFIVLLVISLTLGLIGCSSKESVENVTNNEEISGVESSEIEESISIEETTEIEESSETETEEQMESESSTEEITVPETMAENETEVETIEFESYTAYTNTACNIRSLPSKTGDLLGTYPINTEVIVVNEIDGWSQLEYDGCIAFIKSTLLSDTMTQVSQPSGNTTQSVPQQQAPQTQNSGLSPELQALLEKEKAERGTVQYSDTYGQTSGISEADKQAIADLSENVVVY